MKFFSKLASLIAALFLFPGASGAQGLDRGPELDQSQDYFAVIHTRLGVFYLRLYEDVAPKTVKNFVNLAEGTAEFKNPVNGKVEKRPYYDGVLFHRVIPEFMIQTGDPTGTGSGDPGYKFEDEVHAKSDFDKPGLLAMANSGPNTNGSQFFITEVPTTWLSKRHTIFGAVLEGSGGVELVKEIARVPKGSGDKPSDPVRMELVEIVRMADGTSDADALAALKNRKQQTE